MREIFDVYQGLSRPRALQSSASYEQRPFPHVNKKISSTTPGRRDRAPRLELVRLVATSALAQMRRPGGSSGAVVAKSSVGRVTLVGAGPGDPELLTIRAVRALMCADTVVYDHLVNEAVLELAPDDAELIYAGKKSNHHSLPQADINRLLADLALSGKRVVRLKGGDPFIFGRGGEEIEYLFQHKVAVEVVPGITSASGAACYAGIPLTHRDYAQSCVFVTGHLKQGGCDLDWGALARPHQTLVIYMGLGQIEEICAQLMRHGMAAALPAALIERATTREQRVLCGCVGDLAKMAAQHAVRPPALIVIGEVVRMRARLGRELMAAPVASADCAGVAESVK